MKNTTTCTWCLRLSLARSSGRISSIDAPVVPMKLASTAPMARMAVFSPRRALEIAAHIDAARHRVQRRQQDHEGQVLGQQRMHQVGQGRTRTEHRCKGQQEGQRPGRRQLAEMPVPEMGRHQRNQGNRQQHARKGHAPEHRQLAAIDLGRQGPGGHAGDKQHQQSTQGLHGPVSSLFCIHCPLLAAGRAAIKSVPRAPRSRTPGADRPRYFSSSHMLLPGVSESLATGWPLQRVIFDDDLQRHMVGRVAQVVGQVGADAKGQLAAPVEALEQLDGARHRQAVAEDQRLGQRIDAVGAVVGQQPLAPLERVPAVMARAIEELAEVQVEIAQEGRHAVDIRQRNAQVAPVLARPGLEAEDLAVAQARAQGLAGLQVFMGQRAQGPHAQLHGIQHVAGARELPLGLRGMRRAGPGVRTARAAPLHARPAKNGGACRSRQS